MTKEEYIALKNNLNQLRTIEIPSLGKQLNDSNNDLSSLMTNLDNTQTEYDSIQHEWKKGGLWEKGHQERLSGKANELSSLNSIVKVKKDEVDSFQKKYNDAVSKYKSDLETFKTESKNRKTQFVSKNKYYLIGGGILLFIVLKKILK